MSGRLLQLSRHLAGWLGWYSRTFIFFAASALIPGVKGRTAGMPRVIIFTRQDHVESALFEGVKKGSTAVVHCGVCAPGVAISDGVSSEPDAVRQQSQRESEEGG